MKIIEYIVHGRCLKSTLHPLFGATRYIKYSLTLSVAASSRISGYLMWHKAALKRFIRGWGQDSIVGTTSCVLGGTVVGMCLLTVRHPLWKSILPMSVVINTYFFAALAAKIRRRKTFARNLLEPLHRTRKSRIPKRNASMTHVPSTAGVFAAQQRHSDPAAIVSVLCGRGISRVAHHH